MAPPSTSKFLDRGEELEVENDPAAPTPEQRLMAAILRRAIWDFVFYREVNKKAFPLAHALAVDAAGWLFWDGTEMYDEHGRFTFLHICETLNVCPRRIRAGALKLNREDVRKLNNAFKES